MTELPRRRLLAATGTALTGAVAGCTGSDDDGNGTDGSEEPETGSETTGTGGETLLGEISLENLSDETHTIDVIVEFDGDPDHWSTHELAADSGVDLERNWPSEPGSFRVLLRLNEGEPTHITPASLGNADCVNVFALVDRDGELNVLSDTDGGPCGDGDVALDDAEE